MAPNTKDKWVRRFLITETSRHKKGFTIYKVTSVIYPKSAPEAVSRVSIWKRYNEFRKLHLELSSRHDSLRIKEPFPPFPKPRFFGRFEAEVIEERRQCAIRLLEFIAKHTALFTSNVFVKFFETGHSRLLAPDCSVSLSSDTSEDDYNLNSALRGTNYIPTPVSGTENSPNCTNLEHSAEDNQAAADLETDKHLLDHSNPDFHSKTDYPGLDLSQNNNYIQEIHSGICNDVQKGSTDPSGNVNESVNSHNPFPPLDHISLQKSNSFLVNDGSDLPHGVREGLSSYILVAAAHMSAAFRHEAIGEFEEAFTQYKLGISELLDGVQGDPDPQRKATVKEKISKYLERAEKLYNRHLNCNISVLSRPADELRNYKVLRVVGSVMLVRDTERECNRVIKTVQKPAGNAECLSDYILRGKVPFMVRLYGCIETESTIFLVLQYASGGKLWEYMKSYHKGRNAVNNWGEKGHTRSASCEAIIQSEIRAGDSLGVKEASPEVKKEAHESVNAQIDPEESLRRLEEEFGADSATGKTFQTTDLLAKSQELLRSVDATIKKSNSIASRLNESESLLYGRNRADQRRDLIVSKDLEPEDKVEVDDSNRSKSLTNSQGVSMGKGASEEQAAWRTPEAENFCEVLGNGKQSFLPSDEKDGRGSSECSNSFESQESQLSSEDKFEELEPALCRPKISKLNKSSDEISNSDKFHSLVAEDSGIEMDDELWKLPEGTIRFWAAEILATLESLHQQDVIVADLKPDNILLGNGGHVAMSYIVPRRSLEFLRLKKPYSAPELCMFLPTEPPTTAADLWSYGVLLYELFTGIQFQSKHPGPFHSHSILNIPEELSSNVKSLISSLLRYKPEERLTIPEIKEHPFFASIDWTSLVNSCFT